MVRAVNRNAFEQNKVFVGSASRHIVTRVCRGERHSGQYSYLGEQVGVAKRQHVGRHGVGKVFLALALLHLHRLDLIRNRRQSNGLLRVVSNVECLFVRRITHARNSQCGSSSFGNKRKHAILVGSRKRLVPILVGNAYGCSKQLFASCSLFNHARQENDFRLDNVYLKLSAFSNREFILVVFKQSGNKLLHGNLAVSLEFHNARKVNAAGRIRKREVPLLLN